MIATLLYTDEYYAWSPFPKKGKFTYGAVKVRLRSSETRKSRYDTNAKTYAHITVMETGVERMVRARELVAFWDEYQHEAEFLKREAEERTNEVEKLRMREMVMSSLIGARLQEKTGMQVDGNIQYHRHAETVTLPLSEVIHWLEITPEEVDSIVNRAMGKDGSIQA